MKKSSASLYCVYCKKVIKPLGKASHRAMHCCDNKMLERFKSKEEVEYLKVLMKDGWKRIDIKKAYNINDRVLNIILSR